MDEIKTELKSWELSAMIKAESIEIKIGGEWRKVIEFEHLQDNTYLLKPLKQ